MLKILEMLKRKEKQKAIKIIGIREENYDVNDHTIKCMVVIYKKLNES